MTISVLIDPMPHHWQPPILPATPIRATRPRLEHPLDQEILDALESASEPVGVWNLLNSIAKSAGPANRAQARSIRQQILDRINPLVRCGLIKRIGRRFLALA